MAKYILILVIFSLLGCQTNNVVVGLKEDFSYEKKATIFDKIEHNKNSDIPLNGMIIVKENETIYSIANKYRVIPKDIIDDNDLSKPYKLKVNQVLFLRHENSYLVKEGDNLNNISKRFAVNKNEIIKINKLQTPFNLVVGKTILIPKIKDYSVVDLIINKKIYKNNSQILKSYKFQDSKIKNAPKFIWPAKGKIIKNYGKFGKGQHYDGIDINTGKNKAIFSAYDGKVAFVGSQIKKFGNLIIVKHNNEWLTAYSNLGKSNVKLGDTIKKQQIIAFTSQDQSFFHFQMRYNRNPVNPTIYLN